MIKELINFILDRPAKPKIDLVWYDGSKPTKQRIADLRYKLAVARGMLGSVRDMMRDVKVGEALCTNLEDIDNAMNDSAD